MKIRKWTALAAAICLLMTLTAAAGGSAEKSSGTSLSPLNGTATGENLSPLFGTPETWGYITPDSYWAQNEDSVFYRAMDGNRETVYQYVAWNSKAKDEIPEATFLFHGATLSDLWIRNGRQTDEMSYLSYARIRRMDVSVYTADGGYYNWEYRLEDLYDPYTVSENWNEGYQRVALPHVVNNVTQVELWIRGWYRGDDTASQYKMCITDILFSAGDSPYITPVPTRIPVRPTATPTPRPTATPMPTGQGIEVTLLQRLSTCSGPGTGYTELGSYFQAGAKVRAISAAYDEANRIWWVQTEFTYSGEKRRAYTGIQRLNMIVSQVPVEFVLWKDAGLIRSVYAYYGPGYGYSMYPQKIPAGTEGTVWQLEDGYAQFEFYDEQLGQTRRVWVPESALEQLNG